MPANVEEVLFIGTVEEVKRVTQAFLKMKKCDLHALEQARRTLMVNLILQSAGWGLLPLRLGSICAKIRLCHAMSRVAFGYKFFM